MMRRVTWFVGGVVAGAAGAGYAKKKVRAATAQLAPVNVVKAAGGRVRERGRHVVGALREEWSRNFLRRFSSALISAFVQ